MPETDSPVPDDWFAKAEQDAYAAEVLLDHSDLEVIVAFHLQQALEKYLKGYLLSTGWRLRRIHDLGVLVKEAVARDPDFARFVEPCQRITEYYLEMRYPTGIGTSMERRTLAADLEVTYALATLIREKMGKKSTGS